ncbi:hypothetical protein Daus18300_001714 [Diaporthe australafricana]|uniref:Nephrocystin 3-like N-terminal domain-containing protein n=1 Tax=Diaporthe australafricana TaxID=127596 RepID=A0ABR3XW52_9PEZI
MSENVSAVLQKLNKREISDAFLRNKLMDLLNDAQEQKRIELEKQERELEEKRRLTDHITYLSGSVFKLTEQMEKLREKTMPAPSANSSIPSPPTFPPPVMPLLPQTFSALSPPNSSLYWPQSIGYQPNSPWTSSSWYLEAPQPPPFSAHSQFTAPAQFDTPVLRSLLKRFESIEEVDLNAILESEEQSIPFREKRKADLIVSTKQFNDWMVTCKSSELLVHGEFRRSQSASGPVSALSTFCATLAKTFRKAGQQQIALVFFCGGHIERDDQHRGPGAMICSFIAQLATLWPLGNMIQESQFNPVSDLDFEALVKHENLPKLCELFGRLVQLLPKQVTLTCILDGVSHYETDEFEEDLLVVLRFLLSLARNRDMAVTVKVLATSPTTTDLVQDQFRDDDSSFISLAEIRELGQGLGSMQLEMSSDDDGSCDSEQSDDDPDSKVDDGASSSDDESCRGQRTRMITDSKVDGGAS